MVDSREAQFLELATGAVKCRVCFDRFSVQSALVDLAQPRWVGPRYWSSSPRIVVVLVNPGAGDDWADAENQALRQLLGEFAKDRSRLCAVMNHQRRHFPNWGRGRFWRFYVEGVGLEPDQFALVNIAWCATKGNKYPGTMLNECFTRHTKRLLEILSPELVILAGSAVQSFRLMIAQLLPACLLVDTLHYAHREGASAEADAIHQLRQVVDAASTHRTL
jgi:hypothetical protein